TKASSVAYGTSISIKILVTVAPSHMVRSGHQRHKTPHGRGLLFRGVTSFVPMKPVPTGGTASIRKLRTASDPSSPDRRPPREGSRPAPDRPRLPVPSLQGAAQPVSEGQPCSAPPGTHRCPAVRSDPSQRPDQCHRSNLSAASFRIFSASTSAKMPCHFFRSSWYSSNDSFCPSPQSR